MVKKCCIRLCKSESYGGCGISFHGFPKNEETKQMWLDVIPVTQKITKNSVVCSRHFEKRNFYAANSRQLLKTDAIPSIFPVPKHKLMKVLNSNKAIQSPPVQLVERSSPGTQEPSTPCMSVSAQPPAKKFCSRKRKVSAQTEPECFSSSSPNSSPSEDSDSE